MKDLYFTITLAILIFRHWLAGEIWPDEAQQAKKNRQRLASLAVRLQYQYSYASTPDNRSVAPFGSYFKLYRNETLQAVWFRYGSRQRIQQKSLTGGFSPKRVRLERIGTAQRLA